MIIGDWYYTCKMTPASSGGEQQIGILGIEGAKNKASQKAKLSKMTCFAAEEARSKAS